jgi:hypothetical protein
MISAGYLFRLLYAERVKRSVHSFICLSQIATSVFCPFEINESQRVNHACFITQLFVNSMSLR